MYIVHCGFLFIFLHEYILWNNSTEHDDGNNNSGSNNNNDNTRFAVDPWGTGAVDF